MGTVNGSCFSDRNIVKSVIKANTYINNEKILSPSARVVLKREEMEEIAIVLIDLFVRVISVLLHKQMAIVLYLVCLFT